MFSPDKISHEFVLYGQTCFREVKNDSVVVYTLHSLFLSNWLLSKLLVPAKSSGRSQLYSDHTTGNERWMKTLTVFTSYQMLQKLLHFFSYRVISSSSRSAAGSSSIYVYPSLKRVCHVITYKDLCGFPSVYIDEHLCPHTLVSWLPVCRTRIKNKCDVELAFLKLSFVYVCNLFCIFHLLRFL